MFDSIITFFKKFGKAEQKESNSKDTAKERLHLVLMQDRANVSADFLEMMKQEIIDVIKKYIDVDEQEIDVRLTNKTNEDGTTGAPALYANIPIVSVKNENKMKVEVADKINKVGKSSINKKENVNAEKNIKNTENTKVENKPENNENMVYEQYTSENSNVENNNKKVLKENQNKLDSGSIESSNNKIANKKEEIEQSDANIEKIKDDSDNNSKEDVKSESKENTKAELKNNTKKEAKVDEKKGNSKKLNNKKKSKS